MPKPLSAVEHRQRATEAQAARMERQAALIRECFAKHALAMVPDAARAALARGEIMEYRRLVRRPDPKALQACLLEFARAGWAAGIEEASKTIEEVARGVDVQAITRRVVGTSGGQSFAETPAQRRARRRARRTGERALPPPEELPMSAREKRLISQEARRMSRGMARVMRDTIEQARQDDADEIERQLAINELIDRVRKGDKIAQRLLEQARVAESDAMGAALDVDWQHYQKGARETYKADPIIRGLEWVSRRDGNVTCVCEIFDGNVIAVEDDDLSAVSPQIHY